MRPEAAKSVVLVYSVGKIHEEVAGFCRKTEMLTFEHAKGTMAYDAVDAVGTVDGADPAPLVANTLKDETCVTEEEHVKIEILAALNNSVYCRMLDALTAALETNLEYPVATEY